MVCTFAKAPHALPLAGHVVQLGARPLDFLHTLPELADLVELRVGRAPVLIPTHPDLVWQFLRESRTFDKGGPVFEKVRTLLGNGLANCMHEDHKHQRRLMNPGFNPRHFEGYAQAISDSVDEVTGPWRHGMQVQATDAMIAITTRVATKTLASDAIAEQDVRTLPELFGILNRTTYRRVVAPFGVMEKLPTRANQRYLQARSRLWRIADSVIAHHRAHPGQHEDLLSRMLEARDPQGEGLTEQELRDEVLILFTGEVETIGSALSWAFYMIAMHPEVEDALQREADQVLSGRVARFEDLPKLKLAARVMTESVRMWPPVWLITREATHETELGGRNVPQGSILAYSPYMVHRHPGYYERPHSFDPDRWLPGRHEHLPRGAFIPFGAGSRICIAEQFAMLEATIILASLCARWKLEPLAGAKVRPVPRMLLRPSSLPVRLTER
jgi:pentalenene oxygenase